MADFNKGIIGLCWLWITGISFLVFFFCPGYYMYQCKFALLHVVTLSLSWIQELTNTRNYYLLECVANGIIALMLNINTSLTQTASFNVYLVLLILKKCAIWLSLKSQEGKTSYWLLHCPIFWQPLLVHTRQFCYTIDCYFIIYNVFVGVSFFFLWFSSSTVTVVRFTIPCSCSYDPFVILSAGSLCSTKVL